MTHFLMNQKFDPVFIFSRVAPLHTFAKLPVHALINVLKNWTQKNLLSPNGNIWYYDLLPQSRPKPKSAFWHISKASCACSQFINQKQKLQAATRAHDPFFDEPKIWPNFIFSRVASPNTFAKLPVRALINKSKKKKLWASMRAHDPFFDEQKIWPNFIFLRVAPWHTFAKLSVRALINKSKKKVTGINKGPWPIFWWTKNLTQFYIFEVRTSEHICKASCACPN